MAKVEVPRVGSQTAQIQNADLEVWSSSDSRWLAVVDAFREELARAVFGELGRVVEASDLHRPGGVPSWSGHQCETFVSYEALENWSPMAIAGLPAELLRLGVRQVSCVITRDGEFGPGRNRSFYRRLLASAGFRLMTEMTPVLAKIPAPVAWDQQSEQAIWGLSHLNWNEVPGQLFFIRESSSSGIPDS